MDISFIQIECPQCREKHQLYNRDTEYYSCWKCTTLLHIVNTIPLRVPQLHKKQPTATCAFALGSNGRIGDRDLRVLSFAQRREADVSVVWQEYLLKDELTGEYLYLSEYDGHWMLSEKLKETDFDYNDLRLIKDVKEFEFRNTKYNLWHTYKATYIHVQGEFPYNPTAEYNVVCREYIAPPYLLSWERFSTGYEYGLARYLTPKEVRKAFKPAQALPYRNGIGATQLFAPWVSTSDFMKIAVLFSVFILIVQFFYRQQAREKEVLNFSIPVTDSTAGKPVLSPSFTLTGNTSNLSVYAYAAVNNAWVEAGIDMVNEQTGEERSWASGVEYYSGNDGGEAWHEGSYSKTEIVCAVKPGAYHLVVTPEKDTGISYADISLILIQDVPTWWNAIWAVVIMCSTAGAFIFLERSFERRRWYNSDYSPYETEA